MTGLYSAYDSTKYLMDLYEQYMPDALASGGFNREEFVTVFESFGIAGRINLMIEVLNNLEIFDDLLKPITLVSENPTSMSMYVSGKWKRTSGLARTESGEVFKRNLTIQSDKYGYQVDLDKDEFIRILSQSKINGRGNSAFVLIDNFIKDAVSGYKTLLRKLALKALCYNPTTIEDKSLPVLYRNTTGFSASNQVVPPPNGLLTFETAASQEHHLASNGVTEDLLVQMKDLIVNKGGNASNIAIWASASSWKLLRAQYTKEELEALKITRELNLEDIFVSPLTETINVSLPDSDMPLNYWIAVDMSKTILQKRISATPELQGIRVGFDTLWDIQGNNPGMTSEQVQVMAERSLTSAVTSGHLKLEVSEVGFGVIGCGYGVVAYTGGATYVEPDWDL